MKRIKLNICFLASIMGLLMLYGCSSEEDVHFPQRGSELQEVLLRTRVVADNRLKKVRILAFDTKDKMSCVSNTGLLVFPGNPMMFRTMTGTHHFYALLNETDGIAERLMGENYKTDSLAVSYETFIKTPIDGSMLAGIGIDTLMVCKVAPVTINAKEGESFAELIVNDQSKSQLELKAERLLAKLTFVITPASTIRSFDMQRLTLDKVPKSATIAGLPTSEYNTDQTVSVVADGKSWKGTLVIPEHVISASGDSISAIIRAKVDGVEKEYSLGLRLADDNVDNPTPGKAYYNHDRNTEYEYRITVKENRPVEVETSVHEWETVSIDTPILGGYLEIDPQILKVHYVSGAPIIIRSDADSVSFDWSNASNLTMNGVESGTNAKFKLENFVGTYLFRWSSFPEGSYEKKTLKITAGNITREIPVEKAKEDVPFKILSISPPPGSTITKGTKITVEVDTKVQWYAGQVFYGYGDYSTFRGTDSIGTYTFNNFLTIDEIYFRVGYGSAYSNLYESFIYYTIK